jgi:hypothetical protein
MPLSLGPGTPPRSIRCSRRPTGATSASGTRASTTTTRCSAATAGCGWRPRCGPGEPGVLPAGLRPSVGQGSSRIERTEPAPRVFDPKTQQYTFVDTCFGTHHLQFGYDANDTLWTSGGGPVVGWVNTKMFDETGDAAKVAGLDGARARHQRQRQARRVRRARRAARSREGQAHQRRLLRGDAEPGGRLHLGIVPLVNPGASCARARANPPETALAEVYNVPLPGFGVRGADIDSRASCGCRSRAATSAASIAASARGRSTGPTATGDHCPEGWTFHQYPGPGFQGSARTAPSRAITPGSTSTTRSAWARTCRCPPATSTTA